MSCADALIDCQEQRDQLAGHVTSLHSQLNVANTRLLKLAKLESNIAAIRVAVINMVTSAVEAGDDGSELFESADFGDLLRIVFCDDIPKIIAKSPLVSSPPTTPGV